MSSGDRHGHSQTDQNGALKKDSPIESIETMRFPWSSSSRPPTPTSPTSPSSPKSTSSPKPSLGHRRSVSGSILAKLNFLRSPGEDGKPPFRERPSSRDKDKPTQGFKFPEFDESEVAVTSPTSAIEGGGGALAEALKESKVRKRKGSLRKTALLGGRRFTSEGRERKNSLLQRAPSTSQVNQQAVPPPLVIDPIPLAGDPDVSSVPTAQREDPTPRRQFSYESARATSSSEGSWSADAPAVTTARLALATEHVLAQQPRPSTETEPTLSSPLDLKSPVSQTSYTSTTDEEEPLTFTHPITTAPPPTSSTASSYFPSSTSALSLPLVRHHSITKPIRNPTLKRSKSSHSPLAATSPLAYTPEPEPHDYTETAYWGYVILASTWIVFTVGMGSCLGVWSWAWDVGETPYAPPELEDDPTLPIVGYYPALIVLSGVVAWVWITVAWVGMKYFRHARIEG